MEIRIGTRTSDLALKQVEEALGYLENLFPAANFVVKKFSTPGDIDKKTPLSEVEGSDFFTKHIDQAVLSGYIDIGVHSSKDLPDVLEGGLVVAFETPALSSFDALVSKGNLKFLELPQGFRIGASSARRKAQIAKKRPDLKIVDVRGTIEERLSQIDEGYIDALIVAHAALIRLGLVNRIAEILTSSDFTSHPKQGSLSLVMRKKWQKEEKFILSAQVPEIGNLLA